MIIKEHLCGVAVCFEEKGTVKKNEYSQPLPSRYNGSLFSRQKRSIADSIYCMWQTGVNKPLIFCATSPGFTYAANEKHLIKKFTHNLVNGYGCENYVWVRELTKRGFPHFHFIADMPRFDPIKLSNYWSSLFGSKAQNSIRLGTYWNGKRCYHVTNERQVWYLSKYIGKDIGDSLEFGHAGFHAPLAKFYRKTVRAFGITQDVRRRSQPIHYQSEIIFQERVGCPDGINRKTYTVPVDRIFVEESIGLTIEPRSYDWRWTGHGQTYIGFKKK